MIYGSGTLALPLPELALVIYLKKKKNAVYFLYNSALWLVVSHLKKKKRGANLCVIYPSCMTNLE
jgi:hypothetical protein